MTQAEQQGERQQHDVEEAFTLAYKDWQTFMAVFSGNLVGNATDRNWSLLAWACGVTPLYKQLKGEK